MAQFSPIDYGGPAQVDSSGAQALTQALTEHQQRLTGAEHGAADTLTQLGSTYAQNILHRQSVDAMVKASEGTEDALNFVERHPFVISKEELVSKLNDPEVAVKLWKQAEALGLVEHDKDGNDFVPTHAIGRPLYAELARKAREDAAQAISLPGWRSEFVKTAEVEALNKQERWLDPKLAAMATDYDRTKTLGSVRRMVTAATTPEAFNLPISQIKTSPSFAPHEKEALIQELNKKRDTVIIDNAMTNPVGKEEILKQELVKLTSPNSKDDFPHLDEGERSSLAAHVRSGLHMATMAREQEEEAKQKALKRHDEAQGLQLVTDLITQKVTPQELLSKQNSPYWESTDGDTGLTTKTFQTRDGLENAFHIIEAFRANQKAAKDHDAPGAYAAMTYLYNKSPQEFAAALFSRKVESTPYGDFNFSQALSESTMHHFMELSSHAADKTRAEEDRVKEESLAMRLSTVMTDPEGGGLDSDWAKPTNRPDHAAHEQFVRDSLNREQKAAIKSGKHLTTDEETDVMLRAAKAFRMASDNDFWGYGSPDPTKGITIHAPGGRDIKLGLVERTAMETARREAGHVGMQDFRTEGQDFYSSYEPILSGLSAEDWQRVSGETKPMTRAEKYELYYKAKRLDAQGVSDPAEQLKILFEMSARANAVKKAGGTK